MDKPLVTIITPVYNCAEYIQKTIDSVLGQNYGNIEYYVIDDASTDKPSYSRWKSSAEIERYDARGNKIVTMRLIKHIKNQGEHRTVNEGLHLVKGKYFMIVNADDPLLPGAVSKLVEFMEIHPDVLCAYPDWQVIDGEGKVKRRITTREYDFTWMVRHHTWLPSVGSIFRSDVLKLIGYRTTRYKWLGDAEYWLRVGLVGKMARMSHTLACWRSHGGQLTMVKDDARALEHVDIIRQFYKTPNLPQELIDVEREAYCWSYLVAAAVAKSKRNVIIYLLCALISHPSLLISIGFWDMFIKRAWYVLRR